MKVSNEKFQKRVKIESEESLKLPENLKKVAIVDEETGTSFVPLTTNPLLKVSRSTIFFGKTVRVFFANI